MMTIYVTTGEAKWPNKAPNLRYNVVTVIQHMA